MKHLLINIASEGQEGFIKSLQEILGQLQEPSVIMMTRSDPSGEHYNANIYEEGKAPSDPALVNTLTNTLARVKELEAEKASFASMYARSIIEVSKFTQLVKDWKTLAMDGVNLASASERECWDLRYEELEQHTKELLGGNV